MHEYLKVLIILTLPTLLHSQNIVVPNADFSEFETIPCPYDPSGNTTLTKAKEWKAYQTLNDKWDGPIDSTLCIGMYIENGVTVISQDVFDIDRPLFVRNELNDLTKVPLNKNWVNYFNFLYAGYQPLRHGYNSNGDILSGTIMRTEVVDVEADTSAFRLHVGAPFFFEDSYFFDGCYITEKSNEQYLVDVILVFSFDMVGSNEDDLDFHRVVHSKIQDPFIKRIDSIMIPDDCWECDIPLRNLFSNSFENESHFVFMHANDEFPNPQNKYIHEVDFVTPQSSQKLIELKVLLSESLHFQPYVEVIPALLQGSDSIRHILYLYNNGGNYCLNDLVEFTIHNNTRYVHNAGEVLLSGPTSCFRVQDNGKLIVGENAHLEYGKNGQGMLLLGSGGSIELRENASLTIDNHFFFFDYEQQHGNLPQELSIYLEKGNTLSFGPHARLSTQDPSNDFKLNVYMNGGVLNDQHLTEAERKLIRRIYPTPAAQLADNVSMFPNPNNGQFELAITTAAATVASWSLWTMDGKQIGQGVVSLDKGINYLPISSENAAIGLHYVRVEMDGLVVTKPVIFQ